MNNENCEVIKPLHFENTNVNIDIERAMSKEPLLYFENADGKGTNDFIPVHSGYETYFNKDYIADAYNIGGFTDINDINYRSGTDSKGNFAIMIRDRLCNIIKMNCIAIASNGVQRIANQFKIDRTKPDFRVEFSDSYIATPSWVWNIIDLLYTANSVSDAEKLFERLHNANIMDVSSMIGQTQLDYLIQISDDYNKFVMGIINSDNFDISKSVKWFNRIFDKDNEAISDNYAATTYENYMSLVSREIEQIKEIIEINTINTYNALIHMVANKIEFLQKVPKAVGPMTDKEIEELISFL